MTVVGFRPYDDGQYDDPGALAPEVVDLAVSRGLAASSDAEESGMDAARAHLGSEEAGATLSDRDRRILEFERQWWKYAGAKEQALRELFSMSATRYYQVLNALVDRPEALAADPMLVKRLRRQRASRQKAKAARRLGFEVT